MDSLAAEQAAEELDLTILLPCLNEAETIETCIAKAKSYISRSGVRGEVLVADNASDDGSQQLARAAGARVIVARERGYGCALREGIAAARGRYIVMGDADDSYDLANLDGFLAKLREGHDLVMGNRFRGGIDRDAMPILHRYLGNPVLSLCGRLFFGTRLGDFHCGLRGFNRNRVRSLNLYTTGMEFASEMVIGAALRGYRIAEIPTTLKKAGRSRPPHLRTWHDGWKHLRFMLMFSPGWLFVYPGVALIAFGIGVATLLFPGPVQVSEGIRLDGHTYLVAAIAILIGVQSISFGLIARRFAGKYGFLPESKHFTGLFATLTLERGLIIGAILAIAGLGGLAWSLATWASVDFGLLEYPIVMRVLIASVVSIAIGLQLAFTAFLSGLMDIPMMRNYVAAINKDKVAKLAPNSVQSPKVSRAPHSSRKGAPSS